MGGGSPGERGVTFPGYEPGGYPGCAGLVVLDVPGVPGVPGSTVGETVDGAGAAPLEDPGVACAHAGSDMAEPDMNVKATAAKLIDRIGM